MKLGPFGYYIRAEANEDAARFDNLSLPKNIDPGAVDLETAQILASLPRALGAGPDGREVFLDTNSWGMFVQCGETRARLPMELTLPVPLADALALLEEKGRKVVKAKPGAKGRAAATKPKAKPKAKAARAKK